MRFSGVVMVVVVMWCGAEKGRANRGGGGHLFLFVGIVFSRLYGAGVEMGKRGRDVIAPSPRSIKTNN